jgi:hypothetical protein
MNDTSLNKSKMVHINNFLVYMYVIDRTNYKSNIKLALEYLMTVRPGYLNILHSMTDISKYKNEHTIFDLFSGE